ncbi:MAG: hypothetical protein QM809_12490 [Gordonia sp. (in: high G+C Gram-positive bacteria)]|uniref:hypothetical protein n=1 Tax=Gordonia sp. (in: high G+C Gram-positive bacteria) TaxID=84139 RepID=UPI0039E61F47
MRLKDIEPGDGETLMEREGEAALTPQVCEIFGDQPRKIELHEAERAISDDADIALLDGPPTGGFCLPTSCQSGHLNCGIALESGPRAILIACPNSGSHHEVQAVVIGESGSAAA